MQLKNGDTALRHGALGKGDDLDDLIASLMQDELIASMLGAPAPPAPAPRREIKREPVQEIAPPPEDEPVEEIAQPIEEEPVEEIAQPPEEEPVEEIAQPIEEEPVETVIAQPPEKEPAEEIAQPPEAEPVTAMEQPLPVQSEGFSMRLESRAAPQEAAITERQLRALSRKHLLIMVRDIEKELRQAKEERESLFLAYNAGLSQRRQAQAGGCNYAGQYNTRAA